MIIYIGVDGEGYVEGYGSNPSSVDDISIEITNDHPFFSSDMHAWKVVNKELIYDDSKNEELISEGIDLENAPTEVERLEEAVLDLTIMLLNNDGGELRD